MALETHTYEETSDIWAQWSHVFQGANTNWLLDARQLFSNFYIGLQGQTGSAWNAQIPKGATIISARMDVVAAATSYITPITGVISSPKRSNSLIEYRAIRKPFEPYLGWSVDAWSNQDIDIVDTDLLTTLLTTGGVNNAGWIVRQITAGGATVPMRARMGQGFTMYAGGNSKIARAAYEIIRTGSPTGFCRVHIEGSTLLDGVSVPDGVILATSDDILCTSIPVTQTRIIFMFNGSNQPLLTPGNDYFLVFEADYPSDNTNYLTVRHQNAFASNGRLRHYGEGVGWDWQNYPGWYDVDRSYNTVSQNHATEVTWNMPQFIQASTYSTPDLTALIQEQINDPGYTKDSGIILAVSRASPTNFNRIWGSNIHAFFLGARLVVTYRPRRSGTH